MPVPPTSLLLFRSRKYVNVRFGRCARSEETELKLVMLAKTLMNPLRIKINDLLFRDRLKQNQVVLQPLHLLTKLANFLPPDTNRLMKPHGLISQGRERDLVSK